MKVAEIRTELEELVPDALEALRSILTGYEATDAQKLKAAEMILSRVGPPKATVVGVVRQMSPERLIAEEQQLRSRSLRIDRETAGLRRMLEGRANETA